MSPSKRKVTVGYLLPRLLLVVWLLDVSLRVADFGFGAFKEARNIPVSTTPDAPFEPNVDVQLPAIYGDLAHMANLRDESEMRAIQFSTDALGFRATGADGKVKGALFGDSFSWSGDKNEFTLPAQLGQRLGCRIYNGAGPGYESRRPDASQIDALAKRVGLESGLIVIVEIERRSFERTRGESPERDRRRERFWTPVQRFFRGLLRSSPIKRHMENLLRSIQDDRLLPNAYIENVVRRELRKGDTMLFLPDDLREPSKAHPVPVNYWTTLQHALQKSRHKLLVVIVPNKYTVYRPLLQEGQKLPDYGEKLVNRNESALRALNIPVINLTPILKARAEAGIDRREYVYWRNDTHWNQQGIGVAAEEIVRRFPELKQACQ
jgi:hypothetical protein